MEGDNKDQSGMDESPQAAHANSRTMSALTITSASKRKSLFGRSRLKEEDVRPGSAGALSHTGAASPNTRIPRLSQQARPFSIADAYHLAEEEEAAAQGSPSPAPRSWRNSLKLSSAGSTGPQQRRALGRKSAESMREDLAGSTGSLGAHSQQSDSSFDDKLRQHGLTWGLPESSARPNSNTLLKSGIGSKIIETGSRLVRRTSRNSLDGNSPPQPTKTTSSNTRFSRLLSGKKRGLSNSSSAHDQANWVSADDGSMGEPLQSNTDLPLRPHAGLSTADSPEKSFAWEAEADFTAGDLQVSDSPPLHISRSNTKLNEIRALEAEHRDILPETAQDALPNMRIDEIRALEAAAALRFPEEVAGSGDGKPTVRNRSGSGTRTRMDRLREREIESLSRRALATARLGEIRERNAEYTSRSPSPEVLQKASHESQRTTSISDRKWRRESDAGRATTEERETTTDHNTVMKSSTGDVMSVHDKVDEEKQHLPGESGRALHTRDESRDVLRRLSVAAITAPIPEPPAGRSSEALPARNRDTTESSRSRRLASAKSGGKPTVGFAGLGRSDSVESGLTKRSSLMQSEPDPTERIEGEMNLFAPLENHSERGSLRAASPESEKEVPDETPKLRKPDPLTLPTPRVTGAFVETPATIKVERLGNPTVGGSGDGLDTGNYVTQRVVDSELHRGRQDGSVPRQTKQTQSTRGDRVSRRSSSLSTRRRARSLSRGRSLINSAKPPTVKDDLLEIQRANQIEDSTLDDIADLLIHHNGAGSELGPDELKLEDGEEVEIKTEQDMEAIDRMGRSLKQASMSIRSAKKGIERLEHQFANSGHKNPSQNNTAEDNIINLSEDPAPAAHRHKIGATQCPVCRRSGPALSESITYVHLPVPRLWYRQPKFRFTLLGLSLFLLSLWYIAESWMCYLYCKPLYCSAGMPCQWSSDYPSWGYALPIKLDEWVTGGQGRELVKDLTPEVVDWFADVWDMATGTDPSKLDTSGWSWEAKRRHRRRLAKLGLTPSLRVLLSEGRDEATSIDEII